ncbi:MAG: autotransporter-associated beta strand repeat-containing protein [Chthoniobacterales bacterium]
MTGPSAKIPGALLRSGSKSYEETPDLIFPTAASAAIPATHSLSDVAETVGAGVPSDPTIAATGALISSVSSGGTNFDVATFLGAGRYYSNGITGQGTKTANLEAGHIWNGHSSLQHVTNYFASSSTWSNGSTTALYDRHATWVGMVIGGRQATNGTLQQQGIAYGTDLLSRAIATSWSSPAYASSFNISETTYRAAFTNSFALADVVNSSFGYSDPSGSDELTRFTDAVALSNPTVTYVVSAGNSGPGTNTVGAPGSGYNTITVGALGSANTYNSIASFSSRAPQDFLTYTGSTTASALVIAGVRAAVDISAPGASISSAYFGGQSGGNNPTLTNSAAWATNANTYTSVDGTSFSSPIVAGGVSLMASAAKSSASLSNNTEARQSVVLKSLLLTGADKTAGWSNGQSTTNGVVTTTQSLDWGVGAGRMNLDRTFDLQLSGQRGVAGTNTGSLGAVLPSGWDFGAARLGITNSYLIDGRLAAGTTFTTTVSWLRQVSYSLGNSLNPITATDRAQADLNLSLWQLGVDDTFEAVVAQSVSLYNVVEHLSFSLPSTGYYGLRVGYATNTFDLTGAWGSGNNLQAYGLAWSGTGIAGDQVAFTMQTNRLNAIRLERNNLPPYAGVINNGTNEVQLYANGGSFGNTPGAAAFQTLTTSGNGNTGTARPLQVGDTFTITAYAATNPSSGGRLGISFRDSTNYTDFFSSTDSATEIRLQLDGSGNWKIYEGGTETMSSGSGPGSDRTLVVKITSSTTFDAQVGGTWYYNFTMGAGGGLVDSFALYSFGDANPDTYWKNGMIEDSGSVQLGYALGSANSRVYSGNVFTPGVITDGLAATSNVTVRTNDVYVGGDAGSQVNLVFSNNYSGTTTVNSNAVLELQHANALGATNAGTTVTAGGALKLYSVSGISFVAESVTLNGTGVGNANGAMRNVGGNNVWNGAITLGSNARIDADTAGGAGSLTLAGGISGGSNVLFVGAGGGTNGGHVLISGSLGGTGANHQGAVTSLYKDGSGSLTLTGANTFTGAVRIAAGILSVAGTGGSASMASASAVRVDSGATLLLSSSHQISDTAAVTLSGGTIRRGGSAAEVFGNLNVTQASFLDFGIGSSGTLTFGLYTPSALLTVNNFLPGNTLVFGSDLTSVINNGSLFSFSNGFNSSWSGGMFTITAIPEPASLLAALPLLACLSFAYFRDRVSAAGRGFTKPQQFRGI